MFPTFIGILDIQSWWEVPSIAHFCSLFRAAFNLLDFDIEDLEEALLTDGGTEGRLVQELIVRLLEGCLPNDTRNDISTFNYQMFLRRLFRKKCQEYKCENPFNTDVDFELLPLRQKVEILRALCDFRLDAEDVEQSLSNLDSDSLRVEPLGHDRKNSAYWYFYGTRLYREDYIDTSNSITHKQSKNKSRDKKRKKRRNRVAKEEEEEEEKEDSSVVGEENTKRESVWQVVCFTQQDWSRLVEKFRDSEYDTERKLYRTLSEDFMPEIPKLFDLKEKQQRRKLLQRNNSRVLRSHEPATQMEAVMVRSKIKTKTSKATKKGSHSTRSVKEEIPSPIINPPVQKKGRQTNNSLASAVGQIVIHTRDEVESFEKKKGISNHGDSNYVSSNYSYKYGLGIEEEEHRVGMHKVLECLKDHVDAWPFVDPVDEEYAPRYYSVVRKPMDLSTMEEKLEGGSYKTLSQFKRDFRLIVDNCRQYNGSDNEYTEMAINLKEAFDKAVNRYLESETSSDEEPPSPKSLLATPASPSGPPRNSSSPSPQHNVRKRSKKSAKKCKSSKLENRARSKTNEKAEEEEKKGKNLKVAKKKRGKKKSKKTKDEDSADEEDEEEQESEDDISETSTAKSKRGKNAENSVFLKTKKLSSKEPEPTKKGNKKIGKERYQQKKHTEIVPSLRDTKENKRRKEDFEEDYEPLVIAKSKCRKIEKKELDDTEILTDTSKKNKMKKSESQGEETVYGKNEKVPPPVKTKKNRKKEKVGPKSILKDTDKPDKSRTKEKDKQSKSKNEESLKNGELKNQTDSKEIDLGEKVDSKQSDSSRKFAALVGNKDLESLDSLKDKISERRREEKLKHDKEKQKKLGKTDVQSAYSKKVPSNGSTFHDSDRMNVKRPKLKKRVKEEKVAASGESGKNEEQEASENKKVKPDQTKHAKGFGKEESSAIQALNQATEQTLHDINKWLDDAPRLSEFSSGSDSPVFHPTVEPGRQGPKVEAPRKRPSSIKIFGPHGPTRPKKIQRTIDRLQPGKSKGNLLLKKPLNLPSTNASDTATQSACDNDEPSKVVDEEPKLSLGTVLKNADSIQLICKSLVASPNPNFSNDDDDEDHSNASAIPPPSLKEEKEKKGAAAPPAAIEEPKDVHPVIEETQKPKSATPNLSAWFKAFGAPKSKKKDEDVDDGAVKKETEVQEAFCGRQRRISTGGSSVSESVSSFSQESPPARTVRSPQNQPVVSAAEPQIRGAGFYQDALSTGSSPYNSPYYATPPRYSAQLPPTPSPQNHPLSPAYPSPASYEQTPLYPAVPPQLPHQTYQKTPTQENPGDAYRQLSPTVSQRSPQGNFPQTSSQAEQSYTQQIQTNSQNQSPVYQHSPQSIPPAYPQPSPQPPPSNYSQPSPQQPPTPKYSQPSPQPATPSNYSQPSPQAPTNYSQPSPQQQHSPYSQPSPQPPPSYSQPSPQQQHSPYPQPSPQQPAAYSQVSPQPPPSYSQPSPRPTSVYPQQSPQPAGYSQPSPQTHPSNYSQQSPQPLTTYSGSSPQPQNYSQPSPQQIQTFTQHSPQPSATYSQPSPQGATYSQHSPQPMSNYSQPPTPQQPAAYSHTAHSPQTPPAYSQLSPQQQSSTPTYSQPSPQQSHNYSQPSPQQKSAVCISQPAQQPPTYSQPSPQQSTNYSQPQSSKSTEEYSPSTAASPNFSQPFKQTHPSYIQSPTPSSMSETERRPEYTKPATEEKPAAVEQQRNFVPPEAPSLSLNTNHQVYQSPNQYPPPYTNNFANLDLQRSISRHSAQEQPQQPPQERPNFTDLNESLNVQKYAQQRSFLSKPSSASEQLPPQEQPQQLLAFQQNLSAHESLYQSGFQPSGYPMPPNARPVYPSPHYFEPTSKASNSTSNATTSSHPPVKKRIYNEPSNDPPRTLPQETVTRAGQEQFNFEPMLSLPPQPDAVPGSQFDGTFVGSLADSVAANPAYARLGLGLVSRSGKEQQQLLTIPRPPPTKPEHLAYARSPAAGTSELDLNLLQSLQSAAAKNSQGILSMSRRIAESAPAPAPPPATTSTRTKKSRKSKQQQQQQQQQDQQNATSASSAGSSAESQVASSISSFSQYPGTSAESISLKNSSVVPPAGSAFNFATSTSSASGSPFYDKDATAAAAAFAFLDEFRNPSSYYSMALRQQQQQQQQVAAAQQQQQQQQQQQTPVTSVTDSTQSACNKLTNQPPRNSPYPPPHPFLHSAQRSAAYGPHVSAYVSPHGPNLTVDPTAYQQYIHSLYALQPPPHHHRPSWL